MKRTIRYQGAIIRDDHILLIKHREHATGRTYWVIPGGGRESHETEEACVQREMREETQLDVTVERLLLDEVGIPCGVYKRLKTYLCKVVNGDAQPGYEPEVEAAQQYAITEVRWFDLRYPGEWEAHVKSNPFTFPLLQRIRAVLGYSGESAIGDGVTAPTEKAA
jgi:ADP-ribose pyrophosphatase YjhB (NUDIX family)